MVMLRLMQQTTGDRKGYMKECLRLAESARHGKLTYHELTLKDRIDSMKKEDFEELMKKDKAALKIGCLEEKAIFIEGFWCMGAKHEYFLTEGNNLAKRISVLGAKYEYVHDECGLVKKKLPREFKGTSCFKFRGYEQTAIDRRIYIPPNTYELKGVIDIRSIEDYLKGMENALLDANNEFMGAKEKEKKDYYTSVYSRLISHLLGFSNEALKFNDFNTTVKACKMSTRLLIHASEKIERVRFKKKINSN